MATRDVEVGEIGGVGFVKVIIDFEKRRMCLADHGLEKSLGAEFGGFAHDRVVEDGVQDSILSRQFMISDTLSEPLESGIDAHRPSQRHVLPVENDEQQQRNARAAARSGEERPQGRLPVEAPGCVARRADDDGCKHRDED